MTGFIKRLFVTNGQYVEAGQPVIMVSQNKTLLLRAEVQQKYALNLHNISTANIRTPDDNKTYTLEELNGKVLSFGKTTTSDNYLIPISLQINNTGSFIPGSFVELFLKTKSNPQALTLPNTSLLEEQGNFFVYVQVTPELFEKREIKIGVTDGIKTEIIRGISENERIVTNGAILIKLAQATGTLDAHSGHVH
jgi:multidrug efflux pump subunit AcrA (membrane-fusion protein)